MRSPIGIVILAAGAGKRFGDIKQLALWAGKPLLQHVIDACRQLPDSSCYVVLGAHRQTIATALPSGNFEIIVNDHCQEGMATSIQIATRQLQQQHRALLFVVANQVLISHSSGIDTVSALAKLEARFFLRSDADK